MLESSYRGRSRRGFLFLRTERRDLTRDADAKSRKVELAELSCEADDRQHVRVHLQRFVLRSFLLSMR